MALTRGLLKRLVAPNNVYGTTDSDGLAAIAGVLLTLAASIGCLAAARDGGKDRPLG